MVCKDLWALHLSLLPDPPPSEPFFDARPTRSSSPNLAKGKVQPEHQPSNIRSKTKSRPHFTGTRPSSPLPSDSPSSSSEQDVPGDAKDSNDDDDRDSGVGRVIKKRGEEEEQEDSEDSEMAELMRENSESEDDDDSELNDADSKGQMRGEAGEKRRKRGHNAHEGPVNNLAVLVVACWTLRIPMMYSDIIR